MLANQPAMIIIVGILEILKYFLKLAHKRLKQVTVERSSIILVQKRKDECAKLYTFVEGNRYSGFQYSHIILSQKDLLYEYM